MDRKAITRNAVMNGMGTVGLVDGIQQHVPMMHCIPQQSSSYSFAPKLEVNFIDTSQLNPPSTQVMCHEPTDASGSQQLQRLEKDLEQAKQKLLVLRAQGNNETTSMENKRVSESRYWTNEERQRFQKALKTFGTDFSAIAKFVGTRSSTQVRTHAQKYYAKLIRDYKRSGKTPLKDKTSANGRMTTTI